MTIVLEAALGPESSTTGQLGDDARVARIVASPEWEVREESFLAGITFQVGNLLLNRNRAPVIDFAMSLRSALDILVIDGVSELKFQGTTDRIRFSLMGDLVEIRASYAKGVATCSFVSIRRAALIFARDSLDRITEAAPGLLKNGFVEYLYRDFAVREKGEEQFRRHDMVMADIYGRSTDG